MPNSLQTKTTNVPKSKNKNRMNKRQRNRRRNKQKMLNANQHKTQTQIPISFCENAQKKGVEVWHEAYKNAVRWHGEHQNNFWRHAAEHLENENRVLRHQLNCVANIKPETAPYYETSDEDEEEQEAALIIKKEKTDEEVDSEYLKFLQITNEHRQELRLKRESEGLAEEGEQTT